MIVIGRTTTGGATPDGAAGAVAAGLEIGMATVGVASVVVEDANVAITAIVNANAHEMIFIDCSHRHGLHDTAVRRFRGLLAAQTERAVLTSTYIT